MNTEIKDTEIRVIGGGELERTAGNRWWWLVAAVAIVIMAVAIGLWPSDNKQPITDGGQSVAVSTPDGAEEASPWLDNNDAALPCATLVLDTLIDCLHLHIFTPMNALAELHVGDLDTADRDIILAAQAADLRRDNGCIVGAFVLKGQPLSWGLSKRGYCAILDGRLTLGVADNSPLFEQTTEQGGDFFRQYPAVDNGVMVENNPENAAMRRALCVMDGKVCLVACTDRVLMNDFSRALVRLGAEKAILLVGGGAFGWSRDADGKLSLLGAPTQKNRQYTNYLVFRKP